MPVSFTIAKVDVSPHVKGDIVSIVPRIRDMWDHDLFIGVVVPDATREEARHFIHSWKVDFKHTLNSENAFGWQYTIEVDPVYISASEIGKSELKDRMQDHVNNTSKYWEGSQVVSFSPNSMTVNIPKNGPYQTAKELSNLDYLKLLKSDFSDIFKTVINVRRYHFSEADVDQVVALGNVVTLTKAQVLNKILDRLDG